MAIGYNDLQRIRSVECQLDKLGMMLASPKYNNATSAVGVYPKDDECPIYSRDAELFSGSIEEVECWILGILWARTYDHLLGLSDDKKRDKKVQSWKNKRLLKMIDTGK